MRLEFSISQKEKEYFIENFVMLCEAGMDIVTALDVILSEIKSSSLKRLITEFKNTVSAGEPVSRALEKTNLFKPYVISLIRLGEKSGKLFQNLNTIAEQQKKERAFQSKIKSALMYPVFIFSVSFGVGLSVAWFILPNLAKVFAQMHIKLPLMTKILIAVGTFLGQYGIIAVPLGLIGIACITYLLFGYQKTKWTGQYLLFHSPAIGNMIREIELARMSYILGTLLQAGVPIVDTLESLKETASFSVYRKFYSFLHTSVEKGNSIQHSITSYPQAKRLIPSAIQQMIVAGERSGKLPEVFLNISGIFEGKTEDTTKNISVILEPLLLVMVWLAVVGVAMAVIVPIYGLIGGLNH